MFARMNIAQRLYSGFGIIILLIVIGTLLALNGIDELLSPPPDDKGDT